MRLALSALVAGIAVVPSIAAAGDYGLNVDDRVPGCRSIALTHTACNADATVIDLQRRFAEGRPYRIAALRVGLGHCSVWFAGPDERRKFYGTLATLSAEPAVSRERELQDAIACFPFDGMRTALDAEILKEHPPQVRARLHRARKRVERQSKEIRG
jgi:hypothetical protein